MNKKTYTQPFFKVVNVENNDIIATSDPTFRVFSNNEPEDDLEVW